jgi:uncharacterized membrane protein YgaE (UPF0421/DUF939 family)
VVTERWQQWLHLAWPMLQTAFAAGLSWFLTHDLFGHRQPFFAPIAAAVCLSVSRVLRGQRAVQMVLGVSLGIGLGLGVQEVLGTGPVPIGAAVLLALSVAVVIGRGFVAQGLMFYNQTAGSAILVLALPQPGQGFERLFDALIGGGIAVLFSIILFPANPVGVLHEATEPALGELRAALAQLRRYLDAPDSLPSDWALRTSERLNEHLVALAQARNTARQAARVAPGRRRAAKAAATADLRAAHINLLAGVVVDLTRITAGALADHEPVPLPAPTVLDELTDAMTALVEHRLDDAVLGAESARRKLAEAGAATAAPASLIAYLAGSCAKDIAQLAELSESVNSAGTPTDGARLFWRRRFERDR